MALYMLVVLNELMDKKYGLTAAERLTSLSFTATRGGW